MKVVIELMLARASALGLAPPSACPDEIESDPEKNACACDPSPVKATFDQPGPAGMRSTSVSWLINLNFGFRYFCSSVRNWQEGNGVDQRRERYPAFRDYPAAQSGCVSAGNSATRLRSSFSKHCSTSLGPPALRYVIPTAVSASGRFTSSFFSPSGRVFNCCSP